MTWHNSSLTDYPYPIQSCPLLSYLSSLSGWLCEGRQIERSRARRIQKSRVRLNKVHDDDDDATACLDTSKTSGTNHGEDGSVDKSDVCESGIDEPCASEIATRATDRDSDRAVYEAYLTGLQMPLFIFHAAGHCGKLECLKGVLQKRGIEVPAEFLALSDFKIPKGDRTATPSHLPPR